jgi:predicted amidohydrolase
MQTLTVAVLQTALVWQDSAANRAQFEELFAQVRPADLIVLPEMFNSGFSMQANVFAESMSGATMQWLKQQAARLDVAICGSLAIRLEAQSDGYSGIVNRFVFVQPSGEVDYYDKRHLFRMGQEHRQQERSRVWSTLLAARAIENQAFVVGCNRVGQDGNQLSYSGDSVILDFVGLPLASIEPGTTGVLKAQLDLLQLQQFRQQFPAALDADAFELVE